MYAVFVTTKDERFAQGCEWAREMMDDKYYVTHVLNDMYTEFKSRSDAFIVGKVDNEIHIYCLTDTHRTPKYGTLCAFTVYMVRYILVEEIVMWCVE